MPGRADFVLGAMVSDTSATYEVTIGPPGRDGVVVYVFDVVASSLAELCERTVTSQDLLFAPVLTNKMGWRKNAFIPIERNDAVDLLPEGHCFENDVTMRFHDETGELVEPDRFRWVSKSGTTAYEAIIDQASEAIARTSD